MAQDTQSTYRLVIERELRAAAPSLKTTNEGVCGLDMVILIARNEAVIHYDDLCERRAELAITGRTHWSYGSTDVTIEREDIQAATQEN